jgi:hypothetical protein
LQQYGNGMENIVNLGSGIFSFVKYINRWIIMPVFNFFANLIGHYGWVIALLTLFIRFGYISINLPQLFKRCKNEGVASGDRCIKRRSSPISRLWYGTDETVSRSWV